jgi:hypothetical protein
MKKRALELVEILLLFQIKLPTIESKNSNPNIVNFASPKAENGKFILLIGYNLKLCFVFAFMCLCARVLKIT